MRYVNVRISRSELCQPIVQVAAYEIPILEVVHEGTALEFLGEVENDKPWPSDAAVEYTRLEQRYKAVEGKPAPVAQVYGVGITGQMRLRDAMAQAFREAKANPIDKAKAEAEKAAAAAPKVGISYDAPESDVLTDEQLAAADVPAVNYSAETGANLTD